MEKPLSITGQFSERGHLLDTCLCLDACGLMGLFLCSYTNDFFIQAHVLGSLFLFLTAPGDTLTSGNHTTVICLLDFFSLLLLWGVKGGEGGLGMESMQLCAWHVALMAGKMGYFSARHPAVSTHHPWGGSYPFLGSPNHFLVLD